MRRDEYFEKSRSPSEAHRYRISVGRQIQEIVTDADLSLDHDAPAARQARAEALLSVAERSEPQGLSPQNIAQLLMALGNLAKSDRNAADAIETPRGARVLDKVMRCASRQIDGFLPRDIAESLHGLALLRRGDSQLAKTLVAKAIGQIQSAEDGSVESGADKSRFSRKDVVMTLGALRRVPGDHTDFFEHARRFIDQQLDDFEPLERARLALYVADFKESELCEELVARAVPTLSSAGFREIGILAGALNVLSGNDRRTKGASPSRFCFDFANELDVRLRAEPETVPAREAVCVLELLSRNCCPHTRFLEAFCDVMRSRLSSFSVDELVETGRSLATLRSGNDAFYRSLGDELLIRLPELDVKEIASAAWAFTSAGVRSDALFNRFAAALDGRFSELGMSSAVNLAWAYAILDNPLARSVIARCVGVIGESEIDPRDAQRLHVAQVAVGLKKPGQCPASVMAKARADRDAEVPSRFEELVEGSLRGLPIADLDVRPCEIVEGLVPDFVVNAGSARIVLECDGESYHRTSSGEIIGKDKIRDLVFKRCGYHVVHIFDTEWYGCRPEDRGALLLHLMKLDQHGG